MPTYKKRPTPVPENAAVSTKRRRPSIHPANFLQTLKGHFVKPRGTPKTPRATHTGKLGNKGGKRKTLRV